MAEAVPLVRVMVGAAQSATVTDEETTLAHLPETVVACAVTTSPLESAATVLDQELLVIVVVPKEVPPLNIVIVEPFASEQVPSTCVAPVQIGEVTIGVAATLCTVTDVDVALVHLLAAEAVAVITSAPAKAGEILDKVHALELTVAVPIEDPPFKIVMVVPFASELVPLTDVAPAQIPVVTTGAAEMLCMVTVATPLVHLPLVNAVAVITSGVVEDKAGDILVLLHTPEEIVAVPIELPFFNIVTVPLVSELVPLTVVTPLHIEEVITGVAVMLWTVTEADATLAHLPETVVAAAVKTSPAVKVNPVAVQVPPVTTNAVPRLVAPALYTVMVLPTASELVPAIEVVEGQIPEVVIAGAVATL